jgi:putative lipoprotein (rSAM/lipoprotein system)
MKKFDRLYREGSQWILAGLLSLLGFSACKGLLPRLEYGSPHATFTVSGKVKDTQGQPLQQIRVVIPRINYYTPPRQGFIPNYPILTLPVHDTLYSKADGSFTYDYIGVPADTIRVYLQFEDPSSPPAFETDSSKVHFLPSDLKGGSGIWDRGSAKKEINMTLQKKLDE